MKQIVSVSLGPSRYDYEFETEFRGQDFKVRRIGTDGDLERAAATLMEWEQRADAVGIGGIQFGGGLGTDRMGDTLRELAAQLRVPLTTGRALREVAFEWALRHIDFTFGDYFRNARVLFLSGLSHMRMARVMSEFSENLTFADPVIDHGISKFLKSFKDLEMYGTGMHDVLKWTPSRKLSESVVPLRRWNGYILRKAMQRAHIIVVPSHGFFEYLDDTTIEELGGKTVITATAYQDRVDFLRDRGVDVIIDATPKIFEPVVGINALEALILASLDKRPDSITDDDLLEVISEFKMDPRIVYPSGSPRRINRFAFVIHPLSQEFLKMDRTVEMLSHVAPSSFLDTVEKIVAYAPPWVYTRVTGIQSPAGVEAEGWLFI